MTGARRHPQDTKSGVVVRVQGVLKATLFVTPRSISDTKSKVKVGDVSLAEGVPYSRRSIQDEPLQARVVTVQSRRSRCRQSAATLGYANTDDCVVISGKPVDQRTGWKSQLKKAEWAVLDVGWQVETYQPAR